MNKKAECLMNFRNEIEKPGFIPGCKKHGLLLISARSHVIKRPGIFDSQLSGQN